MRYERFQVEDVLTFISHQLVQAKTVDGKEVYMQELVSTRPLPPYTQELLLNMRLPHVPPVVDVMVQGNRITLIHPPFSGDPLPLVVSRKDPMKPEEGLKLFQKLLQTMEALEQLSLPLTTTLDPRNICIADEPYILFYWLMDEEENQPDEKWRELLFYVWTGSAPGNRVERKQRLKKNKKLPPEYQQLALECFDPEKSRSEILQQVNQLLDQRAFSRKKKETSLRRRAIRWTVSSLLLFLAGGGIGYAAAYIQHWIGEEGKFRPTASAEVLRNMDRDKVLPASKVEFSTSQPTYQLPALQQGASRLQTEFTLADRQPFSISFQAENRKDLYEVRIDNEGQVLVIQYTEHQHQVVSQSSPYRVDPDRKYRVEVEYLPGRSFQLSIHGEGESRPWRVVGPAPPEASYQVAFRGSTGTVLYHPVLIPPKEG